RDFFELPPLVVKHLHRPPFARQDQFGQPVPVQIAPHRPAHQTHPLQPLPDFQPPAHALQNQRIGRLRIPPPLHPPAPKQLPPPPPHPPPPPPPRHHRPRAALRAQHTLPAHLPPHIVSAHPPPVAQPVLVVRRAHHHSPHRPHHSRLVPRQHFLKGRPFPPLEAPLPVVLIHPQPPPPPAPYHQILPPVPVHVPPPHSRPQLAQFARQQRLP